MTPQSRQANRSYPLLHVTFGGPPARAGHRDERTRPDAAGPAGLGGRIGGDAGLPSARLGGRRIGARAPGRARAAAELRRGGQRRFRPHAGRAAPMSTTTRSPDWRCWRWATRPARGASATRWRGRRRHDRFWHDGRLRNAYRAGVLPDSGGYPLAGWWDAASARWVEDGYQAGTATGVVAWAMLLWIGLGRGLPRGRRPGGGLGGGFGARAARLSGRLSGLRARAAAAGLGEHRAQCRPVRGLRGAGPHGAGGACARLCRERCGCPARVGSRPGCDRTAA